ncbi:MAG: GNAT family N-acetyltransferase [Candidatus Paceibacterota bacterium]|jgi:ribosomal protein S18 acetylase RimI-like enzyme
MENITIRKANLADLKSIQNFNYELCLKENKEYDQTINTDYPFTKEGENYFKSRIESDNSLVLIAKKDEKVAGYFIGSIITNEDYRTITSIAEAENMYIDENSRKQGIGSKLIQQFESWCNDKKIQTIRFVASAKNIEAIEFYKKRGAEEINITLEKTLIK